jgi:hypothetical protein
LSASKAGFAEAQSDAVEQGSQQLGTGEVPRTEQIWSPDGVWHSAVELHPSHRHLPPSQAKLSASLVPPAGPRAQSAAVVHVYQQFGTICPNAISHTAACVLSEVRHSASLLQPVHRQAPSSQATLSASEMVFRL